MYTFLRKRELHILSILVVTILAFSNIFQNDFVIDDRVFIEQWEGIRGFNLIDFFKGAVPPGHEGVYRPIRSIFYALYYQLFGTNPFGWHVHSLVVHLISTVLVYLIVARILEVGSWKLDLDVLNPRRLDIKKSRIQGQGYRTSHFKDSVPFVSALLFGLHPIHTETITYIASSMDAIGIVFFFAAFYLYLRSESTHARPGLAKLASLTFAILAFFTNELTLTLPLLIGLHRVILGSPAKRGDSRIDSMKSGKVDSGQARLAEAPAKRARMTDAISMTIPYLFLAGLYALIRIFLIGATTRGPYLADSFYLTMLTMTKVFVKYLQLLVLPINQANNHVISKGIEAFVYRDYRTEAIAAQTIFDPQILFSLTVIIGLIVIAIFSFTRRPLVTFSIGWFFISLLPVSEIIPQGSMMNERMLYIPSFGFVLLLSSFIAKIPNFKLPASQRLASTLARGEQMPNKFQITNSKRLRFGAWYLMIICYLVLGAWYLVRTYERNKDWKNEITLWSKDVAVYPTENAYAYYQLGNALVRAGRVDEAIPLYERSNVINTKFVLGLGSIAIIYGNSGRTEDAKAMYEQAIAKNPTFWEGRFNLGNIYLKQGELEKAALHYQKTLEVNPTFEPARQNLDYIRTIRK